MATFDEVECGDLRCNTLTVQGGILVAGGITGGVNVQDEGVPLAGNPHTALNFAGAGVTATDAGGGVATITVPGVFAATLQQAGTALLIVAQTGQFANPVFFAPGVYSLDLPVIAGVTTAVQVFPQITARTGSPVFGVADVVFTAGHATILITLVDNTGLPATTPFTLTVTTV